MSKQRFDLRTFAIIALAAVGGALWAGYNLLSAGDSRDLSVFRELVWAVFATPFVTFFGWAVARPGERWRAAFVCFLIYFFSIFAAARVERLILGEQMASATKHALYYRLTLAFDLLGCLGAALQRARVEGTIPAPKEPTAYTTSSET